MRAFVALTLVTAIVISYGSSSASADDPVISPPIPSATDSAPSSSFEQMAPVEQQFVPSAPQEMPSYETYPPAEYTVQPPVTSSGAYDSMPRPSYEEVASGYPAPSHSLVPSALSSGPMFVGSDSYGGAYAGGTHTRYPYYNYRSPWTYGGPASMNHTIVW